MAKDKITDYDATASNNTDVGGVNLAENSMNPSDVNNAIREVLSHQKEAFGSGTPLYVDQTNNRVGVNKTPTVALDVSGDLTVSGAISGTDMELLHTSTVTSNVGEVQIDGHFTSAFKNYIVIGSNVHLDTDNINLNLKFMSGGSLITGSVHRSGMMRVMNDSTIVTPIGESTDTEFAKVLGDKIGSATGEHTNFEIMLYDPLATDNFKHFRAMTTNNDNSNRLRNILASGFYNSGQSALSGIEIVPASGNIASGVFKLYGLR